MRRGPETRLAPCKSRPGACQQAAMTGQSHPPCPTNVLPGRPSWIPQLPQGGHLRTHTGCHLLLYRADSPDEHSSAATRRQGRENLRAEGKRRQPAEEPRPGSHASGPGPQILPGRLASGMQLCSRSGPWFAVLGNGDNSGVLCKDLKIDS